MLLRSHMPAWKKLLISAQKASIAQKTAACISTDYLTLDYQHQRVDSEIMQLLCELAEACHLKKKINELRSGACVNNTENKPALHSLLRSFSREPFMFNDHDVMQDITATRERMRDISESLRAGTWLGSSGLPITDVINIGIGGSHLGPQLTLHALDDYVTPALSFHFLSNADKSAFRRVTARLNPATTLFIVSSKSFTTQETLHHMTQALAWLGYDADFNQHVIAVTACVSAAKKRGFKHILPIWDWVGGRFSVCSAINLITCIAIGMDAFLDFLRGAEVMDQHFYHADFEHNLPVMLGLLGIWNNNFLHIHQLLLLTYTQNLEYFAAYIQQLDMESNGKSINQDGINIDYATAPVVWGGLGNQAQHSYYQLLCQGTHTMAADLISVDTDEGHMIHHMCAAHAHILTKGLHDTQGLSHVAAGSMVLNHLRMADNTPRSLGALIAAYEHKIFTQSVIWDINPFDQPGVESAKKWVVHAMQKSQASLVQESCV